MKLSTLVSSVAFAGGVLAAESICDKYTSALLGENTGPNQHTLLVLVVNTAVIGNYTKPNVGIAVPGLLTPTTYMGEAVNLLQYFDGALASTNNGGSCGTVMNFLDGGGAAPLMKNMPADDKTSNQYTLLTHLYQFFAALLGCSEYGSTYKTYEGVNGMYEVHKFMDLSAAEVGWFIENVGLSAASFGVTSEDVQTVATALTDTFAYRCSAPASVPAFETPELQAICINCDCPVSSSNDCEAYGPVISPLTAAELEDGESCGYGENCGYGGGWGWQGHQWGWQGHGWGSWRR